MYSVKEIFYSLQGEGAQAGRASIFCRFSGCNLWSGREQDRAKAQCDFCDTDFVGTDGELGGKYPTAEQLADTVAALWRRRSNQAQGGTPYVICTGGEPLLQLDETLIQAFQARGFEVAVETNGTLPAPAGLDWICVSPKGSSELVQLRGHELKLVHPQSGVDPADFASLDFDNFYLQPLDGGDNNANLNACLSYCHEHPRWRLSLQVHKLVDIP
ncbi:7-carboxy-7-deazaguanine synthase [Motiliproteus coralliicola]|uniref:7-carboxy-7-deazaguanine synthase n=1 Tax=Motiliproteus coralliicola TaxID=2283196 RepID=A0A369WRH9_9GAMM|nr:7-carboxy-7-deazaguanine synthase [Motiliproteus coralliicola]RDE24292.1 7-carboxy-7-deazaguanine synthase [Motiliproteus coralliicola]